MNKERRMSTSPPLPQLLPEVSRSGRPLTSASSLSKSPSVHFNNNLDSLAPRLASPGTDDDPIISMPILQPNDAFGEDDSSLSLFKEASREIYMDNVIENLVESYRRQESTCSVPDNDDSSNSVKKSESSVEEEETSPYTVTSANDSKDDSLEDVYVEWPRTETTRREDEPAQDKDYRISDENAVLCALSIPEAFVPTPHQEFIKDLDSRSSKKQKMLLNAAGHRPSLSQNGDETEQVTGGENPIAKETDRKLRSAFAKYKKWDEAERSKLEKLGDNKILVNGSVIVEIDYTNYVKEEDVVLEMDEDWNTCPMPPLPKPTAPNCQAPACRLGCICSSITQDSATRTHCGKPKCFFECTCQQTLFSNGDDGDIRSRLRPRVSLLNWRYIESAEREKDPPVNYRQLERGAAIYPRMRRVPVAPKRFRNEFILSHKFKDTFGRERRTKVSGLKFLHNQKVVKRDSRINIYRRNFSARPSTARLTETLPAKLGKCKPCTVTIDPLKSSAVKPKTSLPNEKAAVVDQTVIKDQAHIQVPQLIQIIIEDGQVLLLGLESMCFFAWTLHAKQPKAVLYSSVKGDMMPIPWLYLPVPSFGESWIFHQVSENLKHCSYIYIPEINCVIPSKALQMHFNVAQAKKKGVSLKILYIGDDSQKKMGNIYIFPEIPGVLICGPFPKTQIRSKTALNTGKLSNALRIGDYLDVLMKKRYMGDNHSWNSFFSSDSQKALNVIKQNLLKQQEPITISDDEDDVIPEETFMKMIPGFVTQSASNIIESPTNQLRRPNPTQKLRVSWNDAGRILAVRPQMKM